VDAPVEVVLRFPSAVETPVFAKVTWERTVDTPTVAVDSDVERLVKALSPDET
jgi:hypothetical protein